MESSRYKRRETQTQRQNYLDVRRPVTARRVTDVAQHVDPAPVHQQRIVPATSTPAATTPLAHRLPRIDMGLPGDDSPRPSTLVVVKNKWAVLRRWAFRSAAISMVLVIGTGGLLFSQGYFKAKKVFNGTTSAAALNENVDPKLLKGEGDGRINILLLGRGGGDHEAPNLTDTLLIASIDPVNKTSSLLSVPRDFWVQNSGGNAMKINAIWETGRAKQAGRNSNDIMSPKAVQAGFAEIDQTVEELVGVPIHYNVMLDFEAFKQAIDTVGGVTVNAPEDLVDPTVAWENKNNPVLARAGQQKFNGDQALLYARSRYTSSDFARGERQRALILALKDETKSLGTLSNPAKLSGLISAFGDNVQTDLSLSDASRLFSIIKDIDNSSINSIGLGDEKANLITTANLSGQSVVQPKAGQFMYDTIQDYVRSQLKDPYLLKEQAKILVLNGTTAPGMASTKANQLKSYGYTVTGTGNAPTSGYTETVIVNMKTGKKYTKNYLEQRFNVTATTTMPDALIQANGADFVIIIGSDETITNQG